MLATLGYPLFSELIGSADPNATQRDEVFFCKGSGADGRGLYTQEGFVVLKGSSGRLKCVPSVVGTADERFRQSLIESGIVRQSGDRVIFEKDHLFRSPSKAATALMGRTSNGWLDWRTGDGQTLDAVKRQVEL